MVYILKRPERSKLSQGPKNPQHKIFIHNEKHIKIALCKHISRRDISIKATELCVDAGITGPTFYLHYHSVNDAMFRYEQELEKNFYDSVQADIKRDALYILLIKYIMKNRRYFKAIAKRGDHYLLRKMIAPYRANLVGSKVHDRAFRQYVGAVIVTINCWLETERITPETMQACVKELLRIRPMQW